MMKLQEDYPSVEEALRGFLRQQGELLAALQPYRAEVMPVRHFYQDLGARLSMPMPLPRYLGNGRALPTVLVDMREEACSHEVWRTARRFGMRGILLSEASARRLPPNSMENVFIVTSLDVESRMPTTTPAADALLLELSLPADFSVRDGEDEVTSAGRLVGQHEEWKQTLAQRLQVVVSSSTNSNSLVGVSVAQYAVDGVPTGDHDDVDLEAAVLTRAASLIFAECGAKIDLVLTERSLGRRFERVWEAADSFGAVVICTNVAPPAVVDDPLLVHAIAGKLSMSPLQCVIRYHSYEGDLVALPPPDLETCSAWAEEVCKVAGTDLRPEHISAMGSMGY